ncbi:hypothetical protein [Paraburkholderia megapolitana]|jgi:hypothetical protein|uniref:Uncharacterized protein n=1 Tax=Paraburkholderia megapolitana TaxID=420953 RepID=A0A1I3VL68_9BURK|nr:hypothetical protein [Paraburkholderia megapolitana]QDQ84742.1 hypothetical protein FNZ07_27155 [Paraburkholderia megapolitana]SFJ96144.1 hypothetical protein SAMN05192543_11429 [Paraburkholderia megapolitana]
MTWIVLALLVVAFVVWSVRHNRAIFTDPHFAEFARNVAQVKAGALERGNDAVRPPDDPRARVTTAGLALMYSITQEDDRFFHHYSVSTPGKVTPHAIGERFILFVARLLGIPFDTLTLSSFESSTVHHAQFELSQSEQLRFAQRPVPEVTKVEVTAFLNEFDEVRKELHWTRIK